MYNLFNELTENNRIYSNEKTFVGVMSGRALLARVERDYSYGLVKIFDVELEDKFHLSATHQRNGFLFYSLKTRDDSHAGSDFVTQNHRHKDMDASLFVKDTIRYFQSFSSRPVLGIICGWNCEGNHTDNFYQFMSASQKGNSDYDSVLATRCGRIYSNLGLSLDSSSIDLTYSDDGSRVTYITAKFLLNTEV